MLLFKVVISNRNAIAKCGGREPIILVVRRPWQAELNLNLGLKWILLPQM